MSKITYHLIVHLFFPYASLPDENNILMIYFSFIGFNWKADDLNNNEKAPLTFHRIIESMKFAYAPFSFLTDPAFNNNTEKVIFTSTNFGCKIASSLDLYLLLSRVLFFMLEIFGRDRGYYCTMLVIIKENT